MLRHSMSRWHLGGKSFRKTGLLLSMIFTLVFSLAPLSHAQDADDEDGHDSQARIVRISYVEGEVRLDNGHGYESATMNVPLTEGNWLQTGSDGWAEVQLEDGSLIRLAPDTVIAFTQLVRASSGGTLTTVDLDQGEAEFKITKHDDGDFNVTVKKNTIALAHSGLFRVTSTNANPLEVAVWKGEVSVRESENGGEVAVKKDESFVLDPSDVARYALDKGIETDDLDQWSKQRDDSLSMYASAGAGYTQSPYQYGASDLNYYGQYYDAPGYGNVWQPNNVGIGWDPFSNGYWSYSPGFGYTWVSSYPWGWMPYRYGQWVFVNGRGWCWAPGGWNRWYSRPRLAHAPPGFHPPVPPADRRIVDRGPGRNHPGTTVGNGGPGGRTTGPVGGRIGDRDGDNNRNVGRSNGDRGDRRVLTNDDVARVPRTDTPPPQPKPDVNNDHGRIGGDRRPKVVERQPTRDAGDHRGDFNRSRDDHQPPPEPVRRSNNDVTPAAPQPERQHTPPPQTYTPPQRQQEHQYTPPPQSAPVHQQSAPPPPPVVHQSAPPPAAAPAQRQSAPPPESHVRSSDEGSRGRPR
ncbi:MAG: DUF6600 domain-containing protein [Candidatus Angelobacter sp.]